MKLSSLLFKTDRNVPTDAELSSHQLLLRAGYIRRVSAGIYSYVPLATRVLHKIGAIARDEMNQIGGQEVLLPVVQPAGIWEESGRLSSIGEDLTRFKDRTDGEMVLAMTHEEAATDLFRSLVQSYRELPLTIYQIQMKFRDELRPRGGLIRLREFLMKDAYSFHLTDDDLDRHYQEVLQAYHRFFQRCGLDILAVESDTGMMGGGVAHEFMFLCDAGEDTLFVCPQCDYAANREVAIADKGAYCLRASADGEGVHGTMHLSFYRCAEMVVAAITPSTLGVNETKLQKLLGRGDVVRMDEVSGQRAVAKTRSGGVRVVIDDALGLDSPWTEAFADLDLAVSRACAEVGDITSVREGMPCPNCGGGLCEVRGIEAANTFKLGTKYSDDNERGRH